MVAIPSPPGLNYFPFQVEGIEFALERRATLIADEPGLGKTITAAGFINALPEIRRVLIICPASLRLNWKRELGRWLVDSPGIWFRCVTQGDGVSILGYSELAKHSASLRAKAWDLMACDEAHLLKSAKSLRSRMVLGKRALKKAERIVPIPAERQLFLTGTPAVNRPAELHPILRVVDPVNYSDWFRFARRYCGLRHTGFGWNSSGASNLAELNRRLRETCMIRRRKADVLPQLPPKRRQVIELPLAGARHAVEAEWVALGLQSGSFEGQVAALAESVKVRFDEIATLRRQAALAKVDFAVGQCRELAAAGRKVLVFAHHHEVIDRLVSGLGPSAVKLDGRDSEAVRDRAVRQFLERDSVMQFVISIAAGGTGLNLTAASDVLFMELDWTPGAMAQAEDRAHRYGQPGSVLSKWLVLQGSVDAHIARTAVAKEGVIAEAIDGQPAPDPPMPSQLALDFGPAVA